MTITLRVCAGHRYRVHGNMLYVRHATIKDRGTYRCIVVRPGGKTETADAPLGLYQSRQWVYR